MDIADLRVVVGADVSDAERKLDTLGTKVDSFGSTFGRVFTIAAAAGTAALVGGLGSVISSASEFERTMSGVQAVSGASAAQMQALSALALQLGADTSFSAGEAGKGIEELSKAGVSMADIMGGAAKASLDLAAAGNISVADSATIASNAMNQFGIKGKDMAQIADLIAGAANASAIDVGQFKFSLQAVGAVANTVGLSFKDTAVAIAEMGQAGITGSDAGTSLKTMLLALQPSTKSATDEFRKLGLITADGSNKFFDAQGHIKSMADVQQILQTATKGMTDQQRLATLQILFGTDAVRAAAVLSKDGAAGFNEMATAMGKVSAADVAATRLDNLSGSIEKLTGSLSTVAITVGLALTPAIRTVVDGATSTLNAWTPAITAFANQIPAAITTTIAHITSLWGWLNQSLQPAIQWVISHGAAFADAFLGAAAGVAGFLAWQAIVPILGAVGGALTALLSPIVLLAAAGAALGVAWANNWLGIRDVTTTAITWITQTGFPLFMGAVGTVASYVTTTLVPMLSSVRDWLQTQLGGALAWLTVTGWPALLSTMQGVIGWFQATWQPAVIAVWYWLQTQVGGALTALSTTVWPAFQGAMLGVWGWITSTLVPTLGSVRDWLQTRIGDALGWLIQKAWPDLKGAMLGVWQWITGPLFTMMSDLWNWLSPKVGAALTWLSVTGWPTLKETMTGVWQWLSGPFMNTLSSLWQWLSPQFQAALTWLTVTGWPGLQTAVKGVTDYVQTQTVPWFQRLFSELDKRGVLQDVATFITNISDAARVLIGQFFPTLVGGFRDTNTQADGASDSAYRLAGGIKAVTEALAEWSKVGPYNLVDNFNEAIFQIRWHVWAAEKAIFDSLGMISAMLPGHPNLAGGQLPPEPQRSAPVQRPSGGGGGGGGSGGSPAPAPAPAPSPGGGGGGGGSPSPSPAPSPAPGGAGGGGGGGGSPSPSPSPAVSSNFDMSSRAAMIASAKSMADTLGVGLPGDILAAIPIQEAGFPGTDLGRKYHNWYSIKASSDWTGPTVDVGNVWEVIDGKNVMVPATWRVYGSDKDAMLGFKDFLQENSRYAGALSIWNGTHDPVAFIKAVNQAGYATDPSWWSKVANIAGYASGGWAGLNGPELAVLGERGPEYVVPNSHVRASGGGSVTIDLRGAQVYDGTKFEDLMVRALDRAQRGGKIVKVTR